jgi:hypothetical protein
MSLFNARVALLKEYSQQDRFGFTKTEIEYEKIKKDPPYKVAESKWISPEYDLNVHQKQFRFYIYTGDSLGYIKLWDFSYLLETLGFEKVQAYVDLKPTFIPVRKEAVDVS